MSAAKSEYALKRDLGLWSAVAIVVGTVIGSGIFIVPNTMIRNVGTPEMVFVVWVVGGLMSLSGALSYAELSAAMPGAGGEYVYLREAYGPLWSFLYGWTQMWVAKSGSIATLATAFFLYLANFHPELKETVGRIPVPLGPSGGPLEISFGQILAMALILFLGGLNYFGVKIGGGVQVLVTICKVGLIFAVIVIGLGSGHGEHVGCDGYLFIGESRVFLRTSGWRGSEERSGGGGHDAKDYGTNGRERSLNRGDDFHFRRAQWIDSYRIKGTLRDGRRRTLFQSCRQGASAVSHARYFDTGADCVVGYFSTIWSLRSAIHVCYIRKLDLIRYDDGGCACSAEKETGYAPAVPYVRVSLRADSFCDERSRIGDFDAV